jgi:hypothetical protein
MAKRKPKLANDGAKEAYAAIVDYHNNLVHMRFTVAGLFLAANGFLVGGFLQSYPTPSPWAALPFLGLMLAGICWLLEVRTYQLLENLGARGLVLEEQLGIDPELGFFSLMADQPLRPRLLITRLRLPPARFLSYLFSHSFGIGALYALIALFWIYLIYVSW